MPLESEFEAERKRASPRNVGPGQGCMVWGPPFFCQWGLASGQDTGLGAYGLCGTLTPTALLLWEGVVRAVRDGAPKVRLPRDSGHQGRSSLGWGLPREGPTSSTWVSLLARCSRHSLANRRALKVRSSRSWTSLCRCSSLVSVSRILSWSFFWLPRAGSFSGSWRLARPPPTPLPPSATQASPHQRGVP